MASRFETEKFTGKNDFDLWRMKMRAMLIQQGLSEALTTSGKEAKDKAVEKRAEMLAKAHNAVVFCLSDKVLRKVAKETTAAGILEKLESLYMTNTALHGRRSKRQKQGRARTAQIVFKKMKPQKY